MSELAFNILMPSDNNFLVSSNITSFFAIGDFMNKKDFFIVGWFKKDGSFVIDTNVYTSNGTLLFSLENMEISFEGEDFLEFNTIEDAEGRLYSIEAIDRKGIRILYAKTGKRKIPLRDGRTVETVVTEIYGDFYDKTGRLVAKGTKTGLVLYNVKAIIGATKKGSFGMVMNCSKDETDFILEFVRKNLPA